MVVDSSSDGNAERIVSICHSRFGDISNCIRYIHDPCLSSNFYIWMSKMFRALCQVTTPFVVIDSDDDFLDIDFVLHAASLLDKDSSVAAVTGVVKDFSCDLFLATMMLQISLCLVTVYIVLVVTLIKFP